MSKISVVMPVYNGEKYLREAVDSILNQTFSDFEFIIINDCSADNTENIIKSYSDQRIRYIKNEENLGVAATLNKGYDLAEGEYIARMDADDISLPERFEKQTEFLDNNINVAVCGSETVLFGNAEKTETYTVFGSENMKINLLFSSCLCHPAVMIRNNVFKKENYRYDPYFDKIEDYELWTRVAMKYDLDNVHGVLFKYRIHDKQVTQNYTENHLNKLKQLKKNQLDRLGVEYSEEQFNTFFGFCTGSESVDVKNLAIMFDNIVKSNKKTNYFDKNMLEVYLKSILINRYGKYKNDICSVSGLVNKSEFIKSDLKNMVRGILHKNG